VASIDILKKLDRVQGNGSRPGREGLVDEDKTVQLKELSVNLGILVETGRRFETECRILDSLRFQRMEMRAARIMDAHTRTFEWIFSQDDESAGVSTENLFLQWLTSSDGTFWITGKAGSGKSTLMKFLSNHPMTNQILRTWAAGSDLVIGMFYFWYAGTELQKSQEGLLQTLLHQILSQCPDLLPDVLPERWKECSSSHISSDHWTRAELIQAFEELARTTALTKKFCFFVDGLDEYSGDHEEIIKLLRDITCSDHIKLCLSSRPWNIFLLNFGKPSHLHLRLEDLTRNDIQLYVSNMLEENALFQELQLHEAQRCEDLVNEIVCKARGVFLWVFLVIRSLIQGLTNADRIVDLQRRLRQLPVDLETYFKHILTNIDDIYKEQTGQTFQTAIHASSPLSLMTYVMLDEIEESPNFALELQIRPMSSSEIEFRYAAMKLRINARCKDLLEVVKVTDSQASSSNASLSRTRTRTDNNTMFEADQNRNRDQANKSTFLRPVLSSNQFFDYEVDFLHRTVRDFLQTRDMQDMLVSNAPAGFNVNEILCHSYLAQIKSVPLEPIQVRLISILFCCFLI
jgi:NACHT domain